MNSAPVHSTLWLHQLQLMYHRHSFGVGMPGTPLKLEASPYPRSPQNIAPLCFSLFFKVAIKNSEKEEATPFPYPRHIRRQVLNSLE